MRHKRYLMLTVTALLLLAIGGTLHAQDEPRSRCLTGGTYDEATGNCQIAVKFEFNYPDWIGDSAAFLGPVYALLLSEQQEYLQRINDIFIPDMGRGYLVFRYEDSAYGETFR